MVGRESILSLLGRCAELDHASASRMARQHQKTIHDVLCILVAADQTELEAMLAR